MQLGHWPSRVYVGQPIAAQYAKATPCKSTTGLLRKQNVVGVAVPTLALTLPWVYERSLTLHIYKGRPALKQSQAAAVRHELIIDIEYHLQ